MKKKKICSPGLSSVVEFRVGFKNGRICLSVRLSICLLHMNPSDCICALYISWCVTEEDSSLHFLTFRFHTCFSASPPHPLFLYQFQTRSVLSFLVRPLFLHFCLTLFSSHPFLFICCHLSVFPPFCLSLFLMTAVTHNPTGGLL